MRFERTQQAVLIVFCLLLPFNLFIGRIIPEAVFLPLYVVDALLLLLGCFLLFDFTKREEITSSQKYIAFFLFLFFCLAVLSIFLSKTAILTFIAENNKETIVHSMFKQIISDDPTQIVNRTMQIALSLFLFIAISVSSLKKEFLLKIACVPLALILVTNVYLVIYQQDVALDGGKAGSTIYPYSIKDMGRAYFPFVNSLLLSLYLSLFFFVVLFLFFKHHKERRKKGWYFLLLSLLILVLGFTKGRVALATIFVLFIILISVSYKYKLASPFPKLFSLTIGIFLFIAIISSFFTFSFSDIFREIAQEEEIGLKNDGYLEEMPMNSQEILSPQEASPALFTLREADVDITHAGRMSLHWPTALVLFQAEPLFGVGTGMFFYSVVSGEKELLCQQKELCPDFIQPTDISSTAHSIYLQVLAENGLVGFVLFLFLFGSILFFGCRKIQEETAKNEYCSLFLSAVVLVFLLQGLFVSYFEYREMNYLFWLFVGLLLKMD